MEICHLLTHKKNLELISSSILQYFYIIGCMTGMATSLLIILLQQSKQVLLWGTQSNCR